MSLLTRVSRPSIYVEIQAKGTGKMISLTRKQFNEAMEKAEKKLGMKKVSEVIEGLNGGGCITRKYTGEESYSVA